MPKRGICLLSDSPKNAFAARLSLLCPGRVTALDFTTTDHSLTALRKFGFVVTMVTHRRNLTKLDYEAVRAFAAAGGTVASCLAEYAASTGARMLKTPVLEGDKPAMRICRQSDITEGEPAGEVALAADADSGFGGAVGDD